MTERQFIVLIGRGDGRKFSPPYTIEGDWHDSREEAIAQGDKGSNRDRLNIGVVTEGFITRLEGRDGSVVTDEAGFLWLIQEEVIQQ